MESLEQINKKMQSAFKSYKLVFGNGPIDAQIVLVGQNPGEQEEKEGKPFIGRAGKFLNKILEKNSIARSELYITNIVKFKTPENRKPTPQEISKSAPFLEQELSAINPKLVVMMGTVAWATPVISGAQYFQTYHPSAAMQYTKARTRFEADFEKIAGIIRDLKRNKA